MHEIVSSSPVSKFSVLEIPLDKELSAVNYLVETHRKLRELVLAVIVSCWLIREPHTFWLTEVLYDGLIGITWATVVSEHL